MCIGVEVFVTMCSAPKGKAAAAAKDRPVDVSRLDIRVGHIVSVEKVSIDTPEVHTPYMLLCLYLIK